MDKDDNLFEDQIEEDDDLISISLDELAADEIGDPVNEETDEDIIELIDLLEKGDDDLLGIDDDMDLLAEDDLLTEEFDGTSDEGIEDISSPGLDMDDLQLDSDMPEPENITEGGAYDDLDQLLEAELLDDSGIEQEETGDAEDALDELLKETDLEDLSDDDGFEYEAVESLDPNMEEILSEDSEQDQGELPVDTAVYEGQDDLFESLEMEETSDEDILESDDEVFNEADNVLDEVIVSPEGESGEKLLWESDLQTEAIGKEEHIDTSDVNFDEIDDIPLDGESLEELLSESVPEEAVGRESESEVTEEVTAGDESLPGASDEILVESDEIDLEEGSLEDLFAEGDIEDDIGDSEFDSESMQELMTFEDTDVNIDDALENIEAGDILLSEESEEVIFSEENVVPDDIPDDMAEEAGPVEEASTVLYDEEPGIENDTRISVEPGFKETLFSDDLKVEEDIPSAIPQMPVISEEKVEEIVREVVGEVVEKIARQVFTEVAEKVITEAIDSLKKSLESDSD
jgi:hypothetical protein